MKNKTFSYRTIKTFAMLLGPILFIGSSSFSQSQERQEISERKPNVIYIIVDDMGIGDIEPYGQRKIRTPNLMNLAKNGLTFTQHYAGNTVCAPSRAALVTGRHSGHNQIRGNYELGDFTDEKEYGQMPLLPGTTTLGTVMKDAGYHTALIGKWGLGGPHSYGVPTKQGFDYFFGYLDQKQAHNHYPTHLWKNDEKFPLENEWLHPHQSLPDGVDPNDPQSYQSYIREDYAQNRITNEALKYIEQQKQAPFFLYLAYAGPHAALQAPETEIDNYKFEERPYGVDSRYLPQRRPRAARAAMITNIDTAIGKITTLLATLELESDTLIIFTSDNGPSLEGGADLDFFDSNAQFRGHKRDLYEGGIRMPTIAKWPGKIKAGTQTNHISAFWDVLPTLAELSGSGAKLQTDGISFLPTLTGVGPQEQHDYLYWEFHRPNGEHTQAIRFTVDNDPNWKAIRFYFKNKKTSPKLELYHLGTDVSEKNNIAHLHPDVVKRAKQLFETSRSQSEFDAWNFDF
ncbi:sulfatase-like hydrolase/transferase [Tenacibaculum sp. KUL113]|uniref:arylsulfatase n=1 Tax=Alteromonas sp. OM2203 TaxID=3398817 RepID=UPI0015644094